LLRRHAVQRRARVARLDRGQHGRRVVRGQLQDGRGRLVALHSLERGDELQRALLILRARVP
jgi:hypothetical protein